MSITDLVIKNRSCRRFDNSYQINDVFLKTLVNLARLTPSAANLQPLKYHISAEAKLNSEIFSCLAWAAYLTEWDGPAPAEQPTGYITILLDKTIKKDIECDHGIAAQTILLGAVEQGISGCIIASIQKEKMRQILDLEAHLDILLVLALGKCKESIMLETVDSDGSIRYWRDEEQVHHVPKRALEDIIIL